MYAWVQLWATADGAEERRWWLLWWAAAMWMLEDWRMKGGGMWGEGRTGMPAGGVPWGEMEDMEVDVDGDTAAAERVDITTVCACGRAEWLLLRSAATKQPRRTVGCMEYEAEVWGCRWCCGTAAAAAGTSTKGL